MRFDKKFVRSIARDFITSSNAQAWTFVGDDLRNALLDTIVMNCVRMAATVSGCAPFAPGELLDLRSALVQVIKDGVFVGKSKHGLMLDAVREERRVARAKSGCACGLEKTGIGEAGGEPRATTEDK